jgi:hypothetical protein
MSKEEPDFIYGCGHSCVFRFPKIGGVATNGGCRCINHNMTPTEVVELRKKIRDLVNYAAVLRLEHKQRQNVSQPQNQKRDPK